MGEPPGRPTLVNPRGTTPSGPQREPALGDPTSWICPGGPDVGEPPLGNRSEGPHWVTLTYGPRTGDSQDGIPPADPILAPIVDVNFVTLRGTRWAPLVIPTGKHPG